MTKLMLCKKCGNTKRFTRIAYGSVDYTECNKYDNEGTFLDTLDTEYGDYNTTDYEPFKCNDCDKDILTLEVEEWIDYISRHTDSDSIWHEEELPEINKQVKRELLAKYIMGEKQ